MKSMIGLVFGWGLLVSLWAHADGAEISRPFLGHRRDGDRQDRGLMFVIP